MNVEDKITELFCLAEGFLLVIDIAEEICVENQGGVQLFVGFAGVTK